MLQLMFSLPRFWSIQSRVYGFFVPPKNVQQVVEEKMAPGLPSNVPKEMKCLGALGMLMVYKE
jgi:hypothetical protein